jgi:hypothetical protein
MATQVVHFASREELCSELGEVEKRHDGVFQRQMAPNFGSRDSRANPWQGG